MSTRNSGVFWDSSIVKKIDKIIQCKKIFREITQFRESHMKFMSYESQVASSICNCLKLQNCWIQFNKERGERKMKGKKNLESIPKLQWRHHWYCCKDIDKTNPIIPMKVINVDWSGPREQPKGKWVSTPLNSSCGSLYSSFITFFSVIIFILSRSFQQYLWCHHKSFGVPSGLFFSFSFFVFFSLLSSL